MSDERDKNDLQSTSSVRTVLNACVFEKRSHSLINHKCSCFRHTCTLARLLTHTSRRIGRILTRCIIGTYRCTDPNACTHTRKHTRKHFASLHQRARKGQQNVVESLLRVASFLSR